MSRSFFSRLNRRFGPRIDRREHRRREAAHRQRLSRTIPIGLTAPDLRIARHPSVRVAIIGAGLAGIYAADVLQKMECEVTLFEARPEIGGRVETTTFVTGRMLESGAELIGRNHPLWLQEARELGLGLSVITGDDDHESAGLIPQVIVQGRRLTGNDASDLHHAMFQALRQLAVQAERIVRQQFDTPWDVPLAETFDRQSLQSWIEQFILHVDPRLRRVVQAALEFEFGNHMTVHPRAQSLLAVLAQIAGGGGETFWDDHEVYRCMDGNHALPSGMVARFRTRRPPVVVYRSEEVRAIEFVDQHLEIISGPAHRMLETRSPPTRCDFVVVAVPPSVWRNIQFGSHRGPNIEDVQTGPAVKFLARLPSRYWIRHRHAPNSIDDRLGQTWEGTDNQMGAGNIDLTVFAGAERAARPRNEYPRAINDLLPGFPILSSDPHHFANWPAERYIRTGYSCPGPGQVIRAVKKLQEPYARRIFFAGEHVSPSFFGYMEGALRSGLVAADRIARAAGISPVSARAS